MSTIILLAATIPFDSSSSFLGKSVPE